MYYIYETIIDLPLYSMILLTQNNRYGKVSNMILIFIISLY